MLRHFRNKRVPYSLIASYALYSTSATPIPGHPHPIYNYSIGSLSARILRHKLYKLIITLMMVTRMQIVMISALTNLWLLHCGSRNTTSNFQIIALSYSSMHTKTPKAAISPWSGTLSPPYSCTISPKPHNNSKSATTLTIPPDRGISTKIAS